MSDKTDYKFEGEWARRLQVIPDLTPSIRLGSVRQECHQRRTEMVRVRAQALGGDGCRYQNSVFRHCEYAFSTFCDKWAERIVSQCASDLHTMSAGWGEAMWPVVTGHELVGVAVKVGSKVDHVKVGDIVGVGAQCDSCGECSDACKKDRE
jgi:hypothetical protein